MARVDRELFFALPLNVITMKVPRGQESEKPENAPIKAVFLTGICGLAQTQFSDPCKATISATGYQQSMKFIICLDPGKEVVVLKSETHGSIQSLERRSLSFHARIQQDPPRVRLPSTRRQ
jgi:hypothetical protein